MVELYVEQRRYILKIKFGVRELTNCSWIEHKEWGKNGKSKETRKNIIFEHEKLVDNDSIWWDSAEWNFESTLEGKRVLL